MGPQKGSKMDPQTAQIATQIGPETGPDLGPESGPQSGRFWAPKWADLGSIFGPFPSPSRPAGSEWRFRGNPAPEGVRRDEGLVQNLSVLELRSQIVAILPKNCPILSNF